MQVNSFFHQLVLVDPNLQIRQFLGTAFPIAPHGGLLTCRHVVDVNKKEDEMLAVIDGELNRTVLIKEIRYPQRRDLDVAFMPDALGRSKKEFFPILSPEIILMGENVYSVGFYVAGGKTDIGYFKGNIVNFTQFEEAPGLTGMSLSYAVIEGLSGSPVLTYHNGPKVVGLCYGSVQSRIAASEILEYQDEKLTLKETVTRIVELGQAYDASVLIDFLKEVDAQGQVVSGQRVPGIFE